MSEEQTVLTDTLEQEHRRLQQALRESELLRELSALLASSLDVTNVLQVLTQRTVEVCGIERCAVWLYEEHCGSFFPKTYHLATQRLSQDAIHIGDTNWHYSSLSHNNPVIYRLSQRQGTLVVEDMRTEPGMKSVAEQFYVRSALLILLQREGRTVGMMSLDNPGLASTFSLEQQQLACTIGQQAAIAIDNARLYQQAQEDRKRAERLIGRAQAIFHVAMAMNSDEELTTVLGIATQHLVKGLDASHGAIVLLDRNMLIPVSSTNSSSRLSTYSPPLSQLPQCQQAIADNKPRFVRSSQIEETERHWYQQLDMSNILIVPLMLMDNAQYHNVFEHRSSEMAGRKQCVGFIFVNYPYDKQLPSSGHIAFAQDIAAQCALAIDRNTIIARTRQTALLATERANTLDAVFDAMTEGIMVLNMDGEIVVSNNTASRFLGMPLHTKRPLELFLRAYPTYTLYGHPISYEDFPLTRALHGEYIRGERFMTHRSDGIERIVEVNVSPLLNDENEQAAIVCAFRDVTEHMHVEKRTRSALELMLNAIEVISGVNDDIEILHRILKMAAYSLHCQQGFIFLYNEEQQRFSPLVSLDNASSNKEDVDFLDVYALLSQDLSTLHGKEPFSSLHAGTTAMWTAPFHASPSSSYMLCKNNFLLAPLIHNKHLLGVMVLKQPVLPHATNSISATRPFTMWDIAVMEGLGHFAGLAVEQLRWQSAAENARTSEEALRQSNVLKDQFLSITAHEFRTPLTVIQTHSQLITRLLRKSNDLPQSERILDGLKSIEEQTHQLTNIVNTFLEVTHINKGQVSLTKAPVDLTTLIEQVVSIQSATTRKHTISYHVDPAHYPYLVLGDNARLQQVFTNLIQNAIKYSPLGGPISISLHQQCDGQQHHTIEINVDDKGIGIPLDAQAHLFECFYRAPNAQTSETRGVGLGLYIVAEFIRLHEGTIRVESSGSYGEGSRFIITLPLLESNE